MKNQTHLILLLIILFTVSIHAQENANTLYDKAISEHKIGNFSVALQYYKQSVEARLKHPFIEPGDVETIRRKTIASKDITIDSIAKTYRNIGNCYLKNLHSSKALEYFGFCIDIYQLTDESEYKLKDLGNTYYSVGDAYDELGEYRRGIEATNNSYNLHTSRKNDNTKEVFKVLNLLAELHRKNGTYEEGLVFCKRGDSLYHLLSKADKDKYEDKIARIYNTWGAILHTQKKYESALVYYRKALGYNIFNSEITENNIAWLLIQLNRLDEAEEMLNAVLDKERKKYETSYYYGYSGTLENFAELEMARTNYKPALDSFQLALINLTNNFRNPDINTNPTITANHYIYNKPDLLRVLDLKAQAALKNNNADLAYNTYQELDNWINEFYKDLSTNQSKLTWIARVHDIYTHAIEVALKKGDKEQAFEYAEKARAVLLWQSHSQQAALSLLSKEDRGKQEDILVQIRQADQQYRDGDIDINKLRSIENKKDNLEKHFEEKYPEYAKRKYLPKTITVADVQNNILNESAALIEYHWSDDSLYIFTLSQKNIFVNTVHIDPDFLQHVDSFNVALQNTGISPNALTTFGYTIYQKILAPALIGLDIRIKKLIFLPAGKLNYIPFEALPTMVKTEWKIPYLIDDYTINYLYSCSNYSDSSHVDTIQTALLIAPEFGKKDTLGSLSDNQVQTQLKQYPTVITIKGEKPTYKEVVNQISNADLIHINAHAEQGTGNKGKIHLYNKDVLTQDDIQKLPLKARHVVLSACETGTGKLSKGEGVLSLGWSFVYRGVPSVVMSLWKVNDVSTGTLMEKYYEHLKDKSADEALRQAKLDFRKNGSYAKKHPYYWAAFIHTGNPPTQQINTSRTEIWYLIPAFLFIAIVTFLYRRSSQS